MLVWNRINSLHGPSESDSGTAITLEAVQRRATRWITLSNDDYDLRLSKLKLLSLFNRRFVRDNTFLFNVINEHYDIDISDKLIFCKDRSTGHNLRKNVTQDLVPNLSRTNGFKYTNVVFLTILLMNGIVYLIILEK